MGSAKRVMSSRVKRLYAVSTISIALVLFLLGAIGYIMTNIYYTTNRMRESVTMIVELKDGLSEAERDSVAVALAESNMVASLKFVSKQEKIEDEQFKSTFAVDIDGLLDENPLPDSFDVTLSAQSKDGEALAAFAEEARTIKGVSYVSYPEAFIEEMHSTLDILQLLMLIFGSVMLLISLILLNNTVRLAVFSEREMINTLKAVGATKWFIARPFLLRAIAQGLCAALLATALFGGSLYALDYTTPELGIMSQLELIGVIVGAMFVAGIIIALLFTTAIVVKFVNMKSNKIYLF